MFQSSRVLPALYSASASAARASSFPAFASASICASQRRASNSANQARNFLSSSGDSLSIRSASLSTSLIVLLQSTQTEQLYAHHRRSSRRLTTRRPHLKMPIYATICAWQTPGCQPWHRVARVAAIFTSHLGATGRGGTPGRGDGQGPPGGPRVHAEDPSSPRQLAP